MGVSMVPAIVLQEVRKSRWYQMNLFIEIGYEKTIHDELVCVGYKEDRQDSC